MHESPNGGMGSYVDAPTFEQGMLNLVDRWFAGKPRFDTVTAEGAKCPLRAKELRDLSTALAVLDTILRKQNVHVQLNIEHLRKHIMPVE